ncbi:OPT oligopeptide transporter [Dichomitus squalens]|uniref:OPT oligopeptide transporter n=1 Tax=Dichomitus squalens TaxID=114155 RepID=A0A4Q9MEW4_9APHY|nr:OPT oligopeptide transporter [Dichomitus squalens]TBU47864.1 OPT oligopeptide transporter [Dichomitus squalens]
MDFQDTKEKVDVESLEVTDEDVDSVVIKKDEDVAVEVISTEDDPTLPIFTLRTVFLGIGLSAFTSVLATIYTFKPQVSICPNASVSQLFCLIIAYVLGTAMHSTFLPQRMLPTAGSWRYLNPGPFNIKEHTAIVIMASTASNVAVAMEVIAALDLFYDIKLHPALAIFQIFASQMIGYGIAGLLRTLLVYPTYAFYPTYISVVNLLQSLHFGGALNHKKRRYFWIVFAAIFFWEWCVLVNDYPFPLLTAISIICLADNGRHTFVRNLFGAGSSNEGIGLFSFSTSWTLITQGNPLVWPLRTPVVVGMALGYIVLTACYYNNVFNGRDILWMSQSLFNDKGGRYNQTAILTPQNTLNATALESVGLPRYTTSYVISQMCYNFSLGAAIVHVLLWNWPELTKAFGKMRFLKSSQDIDDPHYQRKKYKEVPQWWYLLLFVAALALGIGCSYNKGDWLLPAWSVILFTVISSCIAVCIGFVAATTGFTLQIKHIMHILSAFVHPGRPVAVMYVNLYGNSTAYQCLYMLQDLKLGQYTKLPPRATFAAQMAGSIIGSIFNYTMMNSIVTNNRAALIDPVGTRVWSGWIIQSYNSSSVAMGALGKELFTYGKPYYLIGMAFFIGLSFPIPFWIAHKLAKKGSWISRAAEFINTPIIALYIGYLPYSVNGQWWSCLVIGLLSQWWARTRRPKWFKKYNYLTSAALDGGSQVILFILSFAVFGASGNSVPFPTWWGNPANLSVDRCALTD